MMTENEPRQILRAMVQMFASGDVSDVESVVAMDYTDHQGLRGTEISGPDGFKRVVTAARGAISDLHVEIKDMIAEDDRVAARLQWTGVLSNGNKINRETIDIIRTANGRASEHWGVQLWAEESTT